MRTLLLALALLSPLAVATHQAYGICSGSTAGVDGIGIVEVTPGTALGTFYLDDRGYLDGSIWIYEETNGEWASHGLPGVYRDDLAAHNLQRGGVSFIVPDDADFCVDDFLAVPDALVY